MATVEADQLRRTYRAPRRVTETLAQYGVEWIDTRPGLKDSTRHQYGIDFSRHIEPYLGERLLDKIEPEHVRRWHARLTSDLRAELAPSGRDGSATVARSYRLLRAILQTAVDDELLLRNPCRLPGAGTPKSTERPVLAISEVGELAGVVPDHYRAYVVLAALSGLRAGELAALRVRGAAAGRRQSARPDQRAVTLQCTRCACADASVSSVEETPRRSHGHRCSPPSSVGHVIPSAVRVSSRPAGAPSAARPPKRRVGFGEC